MEGAESIESERVEMIRAADISRPFALKESQSCVRSMTCTVVHLPNPLNKKSNCFLHKV